MNYPTIQEITKEIDPVAWKAVGHRQKNRLLKEMVIRKWDKRGLPTEIVFKAIPTETKNLIPYVMYIHDVPHDNMDWTHDTSIRACRGMELNLRCSHQDMCWCVWVAVHRIRKKENQERKDEILEEAFK